MTLKKFLTIGFVAAVLVACGDDSSSATDSDEVSSSSACEDCDGSSSSKDVILSGDCREESCESKSSSSSVKSSSSSSVPEGYVDPSTVVKGTMTDERDGQTYKTVKIGTQTWMAENLNYAYTGVPYDKDNYTSDSTSWCYNNDASNCAKYGRLYTWAAAMDSVGTWTTNGKGCGFRNECSPTYPVRGVCPEGWHLPATAEFETLFTAVGEVFTTGKMLKSTSGWNWNEHDDLNGNGTDDYSFAVLPAGGRNFDGLFGNEGYDASFWSSTEDDSEYVYIMYMYHYNNDVYLGHDGKYNGESVRCVKDE